MNKKELRIYNKEAKKKYDAERYRSNPEAVRRRSKLWKLNHPEEAKENAAKWYQKNKERLKDKASVYYDENKEKCKADMKAYRKAHPEVDKAKHAKRSAEKLGNGGSFTKEEWLVLCEKYEYKCLRCGKRKPLSADHVIPLSKGGSSNISNIQPLCKVCNSIKHTKATDYRGKKR